MSKWPITPLRGHIAEISIRKGQTPAEILSVTNVGGFVRSLDVFDKQVFSEDASNYKLVRFDELAYNPSRINVGSVARCQFPEGGAISPMYVVVRCRETLLPQFLLYFLKSSIGLQHIGHRSVGAVRFMLRFSDLEHIELPLPPVSEQRRILRILDEADALRRLSCDAEERASQTTAALFSEMFGNPSPSAKGWSPTTLGKLGTVVTGNTPPRSESSFYGDAIEWVKTDNIDARRCTVGISVERLSEAGAMRGRVVPKGSVLITCIAGSIDRIGDAAITDRRVAINQQINAIVPNQGVSSEFLAALVCSLRPVIRACATGVMTRIINKSALEMIPAISPPESLQLEFAHRVAAIRELESAQAASRSRTEDLFDSLLHLTFRGEL
jgi:type I restriction enzyme S subunit